MNTLKVLVAEDEGTAARHLCALLEQRGMSPECAGDGVAALARLEAERYDLLITDLRMPGLDGLELTRRAHEADPELVIIVTTAHATIDGTVQALRLGARDYLPKPFDAAHLDAVLGRSFAAGRRAPAATDGVPTLVGHSPCLRAAIAMADRVADTDVLVLLRGETGSGKELLARRIHALSGRRGPFVKMNCGHLGPALADSQLFGSERGAYTSSVRSAPGVIEAARGGTVFLDEIGELGSEVQVRLLDFLQDRTYRRLGSNVEQRSDCRVLCATHRDLEEMVRTGSFRADLYYRVRQVQIVLPPLRARPEDLVDFAEHVLAKIAPGRSLSDDALAFAKQYPWPGNVREVEQALIAAVATTSGREIQLCDLRRVLGLAADARPRVDEDGAPPPDAPMEEIERWHIRRALEARGGNVSAAARALGIDRSTVYRKTRRD